MGWRSDALGQFLHVDAQRDASKAMELRVYGWIAGIVWKHFPVDTGVYGLRLQEETRTATTTAKGSDFQLNNRDLSIGFAAIALAAIPLYFLTETVAELTVTVLELPAIEEDHKQEVIAAGTEEMERSDNLQKSAAKIRR